MFAAKLPRPGGRDLRPAGLVGLLVLAFTLPPLLQPVATAPAAPSFPSRVASYSWYTGWLSNSRLDSAVLLYQNGVGVEWLDFPQAVLLGSDGRSYRRLDLAEALTIPADQGDPAETVLSPDGTFAVVGGADGHGAVEVVTLKDAGRRSVPVGPRMSALPVCIGADGRSVLLLIGEKQLSPLLDISFRLHAQLARLDLVTGELRRYPTLTNVHTAALSPDGSRLLVDTSSGLVLADAADGRVLAGVPVAGLISLDGDAWSPDGNRIALIAEPPGSTYPDGTQPAETALVLVDVTGQEPVVRALPLAGVEYGTAIGWRDARTVLVHAGLYGDDNSSEFSWVDITTGDREPFATYSPNFTGAALVGPDAARNLVATWRVQDQPVERGPLITLPVALLLALGAGLIAWLCTPRRAEPGSAGQGLRGPAG